MKKILLLLMIIITGQKIKSICPCSAKNLEPLNEIELKIQKRLYPSWTLMTNQTIPFFKKEIIAPPETLRHSLTICANVAETIQHHPDIIITGSTMSITIHTHAQKTVTRNDIRFIKEYEDREQNKNKVVISKPKSAGSPNTSPEKITKTWIHNEAKKTITYTIQSTLFELLAQNLVTLMKDKNYLTETIQIELLYGSCTITLQNKATKSIDPSTEEYIKLIEKIFKKI